MWQESNFSVQFCELYAAKYCTLTEYYCYEFQFAVMLNYANSGNNSNRIYTGNITETQRASTPLTRCRLGGGLAPYQVASWSILPFGHSTPILQDRQITVR